jgi:hypothetical protein
MLSPIIDRSSGSIYFNQQILGRLVNILFILGSDLYGVETERRKVAHIKELGKAGLIMSILPSHAAAALQPLDRGGEWNRAACFSSKCRGWL